MIYDVHGDPLGQQASTCCTGRNMWPAETALPQATRPATRMLPAHRHELGFLRPEADSMEPYPWWIAKRNDMTPVNEAVSGSVFTDIPGGICRSRWSGPQAVPKDADYIPLDVRSE